MIIFHPTSVLDHSMGDLDVIAYSCIENRESGDWYIEATFPIDSPIVKDTIIVVPTKDSNKQPFRVEEITSTNVIEVKAYHIGFDLKRFGVELSTVISANCQTALNELKTQAYDTVPFTFTTDIVGNQTFSIIDTDVYSGLLDIADRYNGKVVFDWMTVSIKSSIGADRGMVLEYGKNIRENEVNEDWSKVVTKLKPIGNEGITLTPEWLIADIEYSKPYTKIMQFDSDELSNLALVAQLYLDRYKIPRVNYKVKGNPSFMASGFPYLSLFTYEELESFTFEELENINEQYYFELGDIILVRARQFQVLTEVIQYTYNTISGFVESVEFGNYRPIVRNIVSERFDPIEQNINSTKLRIDELKGEVMISINKYENGELIGANYTFNGTDAIFDDANFTIRRGGVDKLYVDSITGEFKVGRFAITDDDLVYESGLFDYPYDFSDVVKLRRILSGLITANAYDLWIYDVNNSGTLTITDLVMIRGYVEGTVSITPKQVRTLTRVGATNGGLTNQFIGGDGSLGPISVMLGDKIVTSAIKLPQDTIIGGIVESGRNANGSYTKYSDGTMECYHVISWSGSSVALGNLHRTPSINWNFPEQFIGIPVVSRSVEAVLAFGFSSLGDSATTNSSTSVCAIGASSFTTTDVLIGLKAIGRWKS